MKRRLFKAIILGLVIGLVGLLLSPFRFALNLEENTGLGLSKGSSLLLTLKNK